MSNTNPACTSCVVLAQQQEILQHYEQSETNAVTTAKPPHQTPHQTVQRLCTVVENGKVVVRPIETPQS